MNERSIVWFFNQFIRTIRKDIRNFGIIADKDGTLLLNNELRKVLEELKTKNLGLNIYIIANSGRTVSDMINCLKDEDIPTDYFDYIIGDNGGICLDVKNNKELFKHIMDKKVVEEVIAQFFKTGGTNENIRLADGENIFAYPSADVRRYYKESKGIIFKEDLEDLEDINITKLTITGSRKQIDKMNNYIRENIKGYKAHIGRTSFPNKSRDNYRLDFTRNEY